MIVLSFAIPAVVFLAALIIFASSRRNEAAKAEGYLSRETLQSDTSGERVVPSDDEPSTVSGKEIERAAVLERQGGKEIAIQEQSVPVPWVAPDEESVGIARRQFLNRSIVALMGISLSSFGAACIAFLYGGGGGGGFGSKITVGNVTDLEAKIDAANGFLYVPEGRMWVTKFPAASVKKAEAAYSAPELSGMRSGLVALYQKCPHLGCRVPECQTSQWFECPCHGSQYNRVGEKRGGPAPRGMDRFAMEVKDGVFVVDTGTIIQGPPIGTNTTGQEAEGPSCIGESSH
ncbi:MAG: Rieske 2Fe-2S domain-containing protein [Acidimicrobiales bacterium]|nr:Rieske 2Fe-2S domain-containing protein [Acidimicrobiales bacterium]